MTSPETGRPLTYSPLVWPAGPPRGHLEPANSPTTGTGDTRSRPSIDGYLPLHDDISNSLSLPIRISSMGYTNNSSPAPPLVAAPTRYSAFQPAGGDSTPAKRCWPAAAQREGYGWRRDGNGAPAATTERRTTTTAENHRQDAPGQRGQPGVHPGSHRGPGAGHAGPPGQRRLGILDAAGHDRAQAAPLVPDQPGGGGALRHRPPAPQPQGGSPGHRAGRLPAGQGAARRLPGAFCPGPRPPAPPGTAWRLSLRYRR